MSYAKLCPRRGTTLEWSASNPVLMEGELGIEIPESGIGTGICKFKLGDGEKTWSQLSYAFDGEAALSVYGGTVSVHNDIQLRSGTKEEWEASNPVLLAGEPVIDTTVGAMKVGNGVSTFTELEYIGSGSGSEFDFGDISEDEI